MHAKSIDFREKKCSPAGFEPATSWMQVSCSTHWAIWLWFSMECCSSLLHFFVFNLLQNASWSLHYLAVTNLKWEDDRFMVLGSWYADLSSPRQVIGVTDRQDFSFIYIDNHNEDINEQNLNFSKIEPNQTIILEWTILHLSTKKFIPELFLCDLYHFVWRMRILTRNCIPGLG